MKKEYIVEEAIRSSDVQRMRKKIGMSQSEFASLLNVTVSTVSAWEIKSKPIKGAVVPLLKLFSMHPELVDELKIPEQSSPLRLWYMIGDEVCTIIDVDDRYQKIQVYNYVSDIMYKAFGANNAPNYQDYLLFLRSRCVPESRDGIKTILKTLNIPFYDPLLIIEKTEGRMSEDSFWIKMERKI